MLPHACLWLALSLSFGTSKGSKAPPVPAPKAAPELGQIRFFEGQWTCEAKMASPTGGPMHPVTIKLTAKLQPDRFWIAVHTAEQKSKEHPLPHESNGYWGYDANARQFLRLMVGSFGDWESATSVGWAGDELTWSGEINNLDGRNVRFRHTVTKGGPREFEDKTEINVGVEWQPWASRACKR
jgi:hypothetical protein